MTPRIMAKKARLPNVEPTVIICAVCLCEVAAGSVSGDVLPGIAGLVALGGVVVTNTVVIPEGIEEKGDVLVTVELGIDGLDDKVIKVLLVEVSEEESMFDLKNTGNEREEVWVDGGEIVD